MIQESNILSECYVDTLIVQTIIYPEKDYNHQKGCNNVLKKIREKFADKAALGIIDDDKIVCNFDEFLLLKKHDEHLSIYRHNDKPHYIVKIGKAAENFILYNAQECNITLDDYNLPSDIEGLKKRTKQVTSLHDPDLKRLFLAFKETQDSDFSVLAHWIKNFKMNPYHLKQIIVG